MLEIGYQIQLHKDGSDILKVDFELCKVLM